MNGPGASLPFLFGPYELLVRLGHGGMGQVYLARRTTVAGSDSLCVVKTLKPELAEDSEYVGRFLDEVRTVMQLRHSSISHVFDAGQHAGTYYMAMEHLSGVTGRELWYAAQQGRLDIGLALLVVEDVLGALAYAHAFKSPLTGAALGVVHRDVSPHNVMVTFEGEVKLIDFGLAESVLKQEHTESQVVMGKISYMSPEQARGEEVDGACDQFAAAVMLYELVSGERFYGTRNNSEIWTVVGFGGFRPDRFAELPPALANILERALAADRAQRFPDCRAFQAALEALHAKSYPHATRSRLRAFMQEAFVEQRQKQQEALVRSATISAEVQQHTQSQSVSRPSASSGVWLSSSSPGASGSAPIEGHGPDTDTEAFSRAEPSESLRVPRSKAPLALAALSSLVVAALVTALLWPGGEPDGATPPTDEGRVLQATATVNTLAIEPVPQQALSEAEEAARTPDAGAPVVESHDDESARAEGATSRRAKPPRATATKRPSAQTRRAPPSDASDENPPDEGERSAREASEEATAAAEDAPSTKPAEAPAKALVTNADAIEAMQGCDLRCASRVLAQPAVKDGRVLTQKPNAVLLNCARMCLRR